MRSRPGAKVATHAGTRDTCLPLLRVCSCTYLHILSVFARVQAAVWSLLCAGLHEVRPSHASAALRLARRLLEAAADVPHPLGHGALQVRVGIHSSAAGACSAEDGAGERQREWPAPLANAPLIALPR